MAARPFVPYEQFDVERYTDYGLQKYDKKQALLADILSKSGGLRTLRDLPRAERRTALRELLESARRAKLERTDG